MKELVYINSRLKRLESLVLETERKSEQRISESKKKYPLVEPGSCLTAQETNVLHDSRLAIRKLKIERLILQGCDNRLRFCEREEIKHQLNVNHRYDITANIENYSLPELRQLV